MKQKPPRSKLDFGLSREVQKNGLLIAGIIILLPVSLFFPLAVCRFISIFFLFILAGSRLYTEYLIRHITIKRQDLELRVFRYEWVRMEIKVENSGLLPAFMLVSGDSAGMLPVINTLKTMRTLPRRSWMPLVWESHCTERGEFTLGPAFVEGADPLGLFPFRLTAHTTTQLFVYPFFCSIAINAPGGIPLGNLISSNPLFEDITYRRSLRPYQKGDEPRRINWKASARMSQTGFMVNEYEATVSFPLMIFLNLDRNDYPVKGQRDYIERIIEAAAALCLKASRERQELGIILYTSGQEGGVSVIAPSAYTIVPILERLASLDWTKTAFIPEPISDSTPLPPDVPSAVCLKNSVRVMLDQGKYLSYGTRYLYAGPDLGDEAYMTLDTLKRYRLSLEYLIIDDRALPTLVPGNSRRYKVRKSGNEII